MSVQSLLLQSVKSVHDETFLINIWHCLQAYTMIWRTLLTFPGFVNKMEYQLVITHSAPQPPILIYSCYEYSYSFRWHQWVSMLKCVRKLDMSTRPDQILQKGFSPPINLSKSWEFCDFQKWLLLWVFCFFYKVCPAILVQ